MENIKDQILRSLESIVEKTGQLESIKGQIPQIEIDIVLQEIQQLYERFKLLAKLNNEVVEIQNENTKVDEIINRSEEALNKIESISNESISIVEEEKPEIKETNINEPEDKPVVFAQENQIKTETKEPLKEEKKEEFQESIGEKLQDNQPSLNEVIAAGKPDNSIASRMQMNPISDLKVAIGLNEKFLFTNELFKGNEEEYNRAISKLNQMEGLNSALEILNSLKLRYQWNDNPDAYETLFDLVKRRYS